MIRTGKLFPLVAISLHVVIGKIRDFRVMSDNLFS